MTYNYQRYRSCIGPVPSVAIVLINIYVVGWTVRNTIDNNISTLYSHLLGWFIHCPASLHKHSKQHVNHIHSSRHTITEGPCAIAHSTL